MMGAHHAATGAAAWVAVAGTVPFTLGWYPVSSSGLLVGSIVCAGAALLPDADHHAGTISRSLPPLSKVVTRGIAAVSGGHRHGTHSLLAIPLATALAFAIGLVGLESETFGRIAIGAGLVSVLLVAYALKGFHLTREGSWRLAWFLAVTISVAVTLFSSSRWDWLPVCVGLGVAVHIVGDMLTKGGVPLLWPWEPRPPAWWNEIPVLNDIWQRGGRMGLPILGRTGSIREWALAIPVSLYASYGAVAAVMGMLGR
ncbi:metal-dependent hydrolase [Cellulomonas sp. P22]